MSLYEREDWTLFRTLDGLCQKAGVPRERLRRLVAKELTDNALDVAGQCSVGRVIATPQHPMGGFFVYDKGPGFQSAPGVPMTPEEIAHLFEGADQQAAQKIDTLLRQAIVDDPHSDA